MRKKILCKISKHKWKKKSEFTGGIVYECERCKSIYHSFCACPSYRVGIDDSILNKTKEEGFFETWLRKILGE